MTKADEPELITERGWVYRGIMFGIRVVTWFLYPMKIEGLEHLPRTGSGVLAANHGSFLDIPALAHAASPRHVAFLGRHTLAETGWLGWVMRSCGAILVERGARDRKAFRGIARHLEQGDLVAIFPEGTRSPDGRLQELKKGAVMAARLADSPLIPVGLVGLQQAWGKGRRIPRPARVVVRFGPPIDARADDALEQLAVSLRELMGQPASETR